MQFLCLLCFFFFFFKQKTAYEMRISDWSSDVCSSDLLALLDSLATVTLPPPESLGLPDGAGHVLVVLLFRSLVSLLDLQVPEIQHRQIGRASCRERVCQYV